MFSNQDGANIAQNGDYGAVKHHSMNENYLRSFKKANSRTLGLIRVVTVAFKKMEKGFPSLKKI